MQGKYWQKLDSGKIQCDLCPRYCILDDGQRGFCFIRENKSSSLFLSSYGRSTGFCIDPIEKKPLYHFYPGSPVLSFGTAGCNLGCTFCQNSDISRSKEIMILSAEASPEKIASVASEMGCKSVAFTYNDPIIFFEYAIDTAKYCSDVGVKAIAVSAGYINPEPRKEFFSVMDAANIDLKAFSEKFYKKYTGAKLSKILDTLKYVYHEADTWLEITTLLIPGLNDSTEEIESMTKWIYENLGSDVPIHFSAFHPSWKMIDIPRTPVKTLFRAREIAIKNGIKYVYTGNILDVETATTYCDYCKIPVIGRNSYQISQWDLNGGKCNNCNHELAGWFDNNHGDWGSKAVPVRF